MILLVGMLVACAVAQDEDGAAGGDASGDELAGWDESSGWIDDLEPWDPAADDIEAAPWQDSSSAPLPELEPSDAMPDPSFPEPGSWTVNPDGAGSPSEVTPQVSVRRTGEGSTVEPLEVEVYDRATTEAAGVSGFVFSVAAEQQDQSEGDDPLAFEIDYSGFARSFGGDYATRLQVVALPACAVEDPRPVGCVVEPVPLEAVNDYDSETLSVSVDGLAAVAALTATPEAVTDVAIAPPTGGFEEAPTAPVRVEQAEIPVELEPYTTPDDLVVTGGDLSAGTSDEPAGATSTGAEPADTAARGQMVLGVTAAAAGDGGDFGATPLPVTGGWNVGPGTGEFAYTYPMEVPAPAGGEAPPVGLGYSSGSIDGLTNVTNAQSSQTGLGWGELANGFIERRYQPCYEGGVINTAEFCWNGYNATISLQGVSGPLVPLDTEYRQWRVQGDPGWRIERVGAPDDPGIPSVRGSETWVVTAPDGTEYHFGTHWNPDTAEYTLSGVWAPVWADHPGDPCYAGKPTRCNMAWRWMLDRVVDPDGNVTTYYYGREVSHYVGTGATVANVPYIRSVSLDHIEYGARAGIRLAPAGRVVFERQYRCTALNSTCKAPGRNATGYPDVPVDLICLPASTCSAKAPSFFSTVRYSAVRTEVRVGAAWKPVRQYNLHHTLPAPEGTVRKLTLSQVVEVGLARGRQDVLPGTTFDYAIRDNRVDHAYNWWKAMRHNRLVQVTNPYGGQTRVTYGFNRQCALDYVPRKDGRVRWDLNVRDCFPQTSIDNGVRTTGVFNKYLVTQVVEAPGHGSPEMTTTYQYEEDPAWAFDYSSFGRYDHEWGWSAWRGYGTTTIVQGDTRTRTRSFRGMDGDIMMAVRGGQWCPCGEREVAVASFDATQSFPDDGTLVGRVLEEQRHGTVDGVANQVAESSLHTYAVRETAPALEGYEPPSWADVASITESVATAPGQLRQRRSQTTYDEQLRPSSTLEEGWLDEPGDERCSTTTYAQDEDAGMYTYPAVNLTVAGGCESTVELARSETYYDGSTTLGTLGQRGNATLQRTKLDNETWTETTTDYDDLGRVASVTDATGAVIATSHRAAAVNLLPEETIVTNAVGHQARTVTYPDVGQAATAFDVNGNTTSYDYDGLGRLLAVRLPTEQPADPGTEPSWRFAYTISATRTSPPVVRSRQLTSAATSGPGVTFADSWVLYDGMMRQRQSQSLSPTAGLTLASETTYDGRGLVRDVTSPQAVPGTPGAGLLSGTWDNRTRTLYDELGRPTRQQWWQGAQAAHETVTEYGGNRVTVSAPDGSQVRETVDGLGRTVEVAEHDGDTWVASTYRHDLADNLTTVTDPAGNTISYSYNMAGWRLTQDDPDRGAATLGYDAAGNLTSEVDANGNAVHTSYDQLGRQTERRSGSPDGPLLASWHYDAPGRLGLLDHETRHTSAGDWTSAVTGYDARGRTLGTTLTVPAGIPGLSGSYTATQTYDRADRVTSVTYPAVGTLPQETVTTSYDSLGLARAMKGSGDYPYVWNVGYDDRGRMQTAGFGRFTGSGNPIPGPTTTSLAVAPPAAAQAAADNPGLVRRWTYDADQRLGQAETFRSGARLGVDQLSYDDAGKPTSKLTDLAGESWLECFGYDARQRLTESFTVAATDSCESGTPETGDHPYYERFWYHPDGRMEARSTVRNGSDQDRIVYGYPDDGSDRPHTPTTIGAPGDPDPDTYAWDDAGNLTERTVGDRTETYTWDVERRLAAVSGPDGATGFVYDAGGQRVLRTTPAGSTLYFAGHEITASSDGSTVSAVRSYTFEGMLVATRTKAAAFATEFVVSDPAGSTELALSEYGGLLGGKAYRPYGEVRGESGAMGFETDRGFVGQIEDATTDLSYMNARYYDATTGVFLSPDPQYDTANPKTLNPYLYASGNPSTLSDPGGRSPGYIWGLEQENAALRKHNSDLVGHIKRLGGHIEQLQGIIKKQNRVINQLVTRVEALEAVIRQQQTVIRRLVARVNYLTGVVNYQRQVIGQLQLRLAYQAELIDRLSFQVTAYQQLTAYQREKIQSLDDLAGHRASVIKSQHAALQALKDSKPTYNWIDVTYEVGCAVGGSVGPVWSGAIVSGACALDSILTGYGVLPPRNQRHKYGLLGAELVSEEVGMWAVGAVSSAAGNASRTGRVVTTTFNQVRCGRFVPIRPNC